MSAATDGGHLDRVYVWEWPVRLSHWLIAASIVGLAATGIYIGNPFVTVEGEATRSFLMGTVKSIHFGFAVVFSVSVLSRVLWMFAGNPYASWRELIPQTGRRLRGAWDTLAFYIFLHRDSPAFVGHNPLAGLVYTVVFLLYFLMIVTGLALVSANAHIGSFLHGFQFLIPLLGGLQIVRLIHHIGMWLLLGFVAHHVWSAFLVSTVEKSGLLDSIFTGYKVLTPEVAKRAQRHIEEDV
jgi:Ni/Fe-hydrogenase 1 B-type cytochrome subunit